MKPLDWAAAFILFLQFPIPFFWLVLHPLVGFWRKRDMRAAYVTAVGVSWGIAGAFLWFLRKQLFDSAHASAWAIAAGIALVVADVVILRMVKRDLGAARLMGQTELSGGGELATQGIYARVRHPRYTAMMASVVGVCLMAGTPFLWASAAVWWLLALMAIALEERELLSRFGAAYEEYRRRVPAFLPFRFFPGNET